MVRKHFIFYGMVQGVGFRYRAVQAARMFGLTGCVSNESDGSVSMEVQGDSDYIDRMIEILQQGTYIQIDRIEVSILTTQEHETGFHVLDY
ncbi:MAG: acylphosphatase [Butyrivibrio sp.]|nr:acylphosphatase [Butyrivibrio sp.]